MPAKYTPEQFIEAFWAKVDQSAGVDKCWPWAAYCNDDGYGQVKADGRMMKAQRIAYVLAIGPIPSDKPWILHTCDNPPCCNPRHLFPGTNADNVADKMAKGRHYSPGGARNGSHTRPERRAVGDRHGAYTKPESRTLGERNGLAKLTNADVLDIRAAIARKESQRSIARRHRVARTTIHDIASGRTWKHVPLDPTP